MKSAYSNTVPVFVNHHYAKKHAQREEEQTIEIVFDSVTYRRAESKEKDLRNGIKGDAEDNVTKRPSVIQGSEDENELR